MDKFSFSQYHEDKLIDNYIRKNGLENKINDFIVEIGAAYPEILSNSRYYIDLEWRALLIDASEKFFNLQSQYHATNKRVVVSRTLIADQEKEMKYNNLEEQTLAGIGDTGEKMQTKKLSTLLNQYKLDNKIGILSIDIEGFDNQVLKSILDDGIEAQIIVIEANSSNERQKHIDVLKGQYTLIAETACGYFQGYWGLLIDKIIYKLFNIHVFRGVNTIWILKNLI